MGMGYDDNSFGEHWDGTSYVDYRPWCSKHGLMAQGDKGYYCEECEIRSKHMVNRNLQSVTARELATNWQKWQMHIDQLEARVIEDANKEDVIGISPYSWDGFDYRIITRCGNIVYTYADSEYEVLWS